MPEIILKNQPPDLETVQKKIDRIVSLQRDYQPIVAQSTARERIEKLRHLLDLVTRKKQAIRDAVHADFKKPAAEVDLSEVFVVTSEIKHAIRHLKSWMKPRRVSRTLAMLPTRSWVRFVPRGRVLIISPWNFPVNLTFGPLVSAISAGNVAVVKPSEYSAHTSGLMAEMIRSLFHEREIAFVLGDHTVSRELLQRRFDHIFFTGSPEVGKIVMKAAADQLATVTLELGGKSPAFVTASADIPDAARKLTWAKFMNMGQTCIAPDYVLVEESAAEDLIRNMKRCIEQSYGKTAGERASTADFARAIDDRHYDRMKSLITNALGDGAVAEIGGTWRDDDRFIEPTILSNVNRLSAVMTEEIFGPVLPILTYHNLDEAIREVRNGEKPLALYVFSKSVAESQAVLSQTTSGTACINDCVIQYLHLNLPFGGVNHSGFGNSHGYYGFRAFSHERSVLKSASWNPMKIVYPPYTPRVQKVVDLFLKYM